MGRDADASRDKAARSGEDADERDLKTSFENKDVAYLSGKLSICDSSRELPQSENSSTPRRRCNCSRRWRASSSNGRSRLSENLPPSGRATRESCYCRPSHPPHRSLWPVDTGRPRTVARSTVKVARAVNSAMLLVNWRSKPGDMARLGKIAERIRAKL